MDLGKPLKNMPLLSRFFRGKEITFLVVIRGEHQAPQKKDFIAPPCLQA